MVCVFVRRLFAIAALLVLGCGFAWCGSPVTGDAIVVAPAALSNGSPFLLTVSLAEAAMSVTGTWQGHTVEFF